MKPGDMMAKTIGIAPETRDVWPMTLTDWRNHIKKLPTYSEHKITMHIDRAQAMVDMIRAMEPPYNEPEWCDRVQAIIDEKKKATTINMIICPDMIDQGGT
jgi:hypothetical protein